MDENIIKFGKAGKALKRQDKEKTAAANRAKFGRTKSEKQRDALEALKHKNSVDSHQRDKE